LSLISLRAEAVGKMRFGAVIAAAAVMFATASVPAYAGLLDVTTKGMTSIPETSTGGLCCWASPGWDSPDGGGVRRKRHDARLLPTPWCQEEEAHVSQPFVGQIIAVGFDYAPAGWALCQGQLLPISENQALFNLIGTTFGGNGQTTFGLPDLRGRAALGVGQGPGLEGYILGKVGGVESAPLNGAQIGSHTHALSAAATATTSTPSSSVVLGAPAEATPIYATSGAGATLTAGTVAPNPGGGQPHENRQPSLTINYIISLFGVSPSQT
jgi:microcystin-dependent protein